MCGRYTWKKNSLGQFKKLVKEPAPNVEPNFNRAPGQSHPVIISHNGYAKWEEMIWGSPKTNKSADFFPINARSETVADKLIFQESFSETRCLIPADGWFEWQVIEGTKYPHYISSEQNEVFAFAGIWKKFLGPDSSKTVFSVLTLNAPSNTLHIHHRAPMALIEAHWRNWLNGDHEHLSSLLQSDQPKWNAMQVSSRVNSTRNNEPKLLDPFSGKQSLLF
jgi:putative SOS response-associated peptidase YedK